MQCFIRILKCSTWEHIKDATNCLYRGVPANYKLQEYIVQDNFLASVWFAIKFCKQVPLDRRYIFPRNHTTCIIKDTANQSFTI